MESSPASCNGSQAAKDSLTVLTPLNASCHPQGCLLPHVKSSNGEHHQQVPVMWLEIAPSTIRLTKHGRHPLLAPSWLSTSQGCAPTTKRTSHRSVLLSSKTRVLIDGDGATRGTGAGVERSDPSPGVSLVRMQKPSITGAAWPPIYSSMNGTHAARGSDLKTLTGLKSKMP